ncbi:hypothetical protein [Streptomyces flavidovirens]|uniref:hypothetical protein n=1 Tax=Streptomyces flavidovirens TaxID=67298 RepID=UPI0036A73794
MLCTDLPPAAGIAPRMLDTLVEAPGSDPFVGPDQQALEHMLASFEPRPDGTVPPQAM